MSNSKPLELPVLLLDRNIGSKGLRRCLEEAKWLRRSQGELQFAKDAPDCDLIRAAGQNAMLFVTADCALRRRAISVQAAIDGGTRIMFVPASQPPRDLFAALWMARHELVEVLNQCSGAAFLELATRAKGLASLSKHQPGSMKLAKDGKLAARKKTPRAIRKKMGVGPPSSQIMLPGIGASGASQASE